MKRNQALIIIAGLCAALAAPLSAQTKPAKTLTTVFEATARGIGQGITDGTSNTLIVAGVATMNVDSAGAFTGQITPAKDANGNDLGAVVFHRRSLHPVAGAPKTLSFSGQINGRQMSLMIRFSDGYMISGSGASTDDLGSMQDGPITGAIAGTATAHFVDGTSNTIMFGEDTVIGDWAASSGGIRFAMTDGSVRFIKY